MRAVLDKGETRPLVDSSFLRSRFFHTSGLLVRARAPLRSRPSSINAPLRIVAMHKWPPRCDGALGAHHRGEARGPFHCLVAQHDAADL